MPVTRYKSSSPYNKTPQTSWYLNHFVRKTIFPDYTDKLVIIEKRFHHRPDLMSFQLYGTPDFWWVLMERNIDTIRDPIYDFIEGKQIWCPTLDRILKL